MCYMHSMSPNKDVQCLCVNKMVALHCTVWCARSWSRVVLWLVYCRLASTFRDMTSIGGTPPCLSWPQQSLVVISTMQNGWLQTNLVSSVTMGLIHNSDPIFRQYFSQVTIAHLWPFLMTFDTARMGLSCPSHWGVVWFLGHRPPAWFLEFGTKSAC